MIITRAPLRISFVGGGSDLPSYYEKSDGAVLSMAINKYVHVAINPKFDDAIRVSYSKTETVNKVSEIEHSIVKACLDFLGIDGGLEIVTIADIPSGGTGLGSSSSFTVALLHGLHAFKGEYVSEAKLAEEACHIEIDICGAPIGKQDQYIAAYGGINYIQFLRNGNVDVSPVICKSAIIEQLMQNLIVFYTGRSRSASNILSKQSENTRSNSTARASLERMVALAANMRDALHDGQLSNFGDLLHDNWLLKRSLAESVSDSVIDEWYERGLKAGAEGGKILGAGGGGFLLFYAPQDRHKAIAEALNELRHVPLSLERNGSSVIFYHP